MFHIVEKRRWYFLFSSLVIIIGLVTMIYSTITTGLPFKLAIDFTGGSLWQLAFDQPVQPAELRQVFVDQGISDPAVTTLGDGNSLRYCDTIRAVRSRTHESRSGRRACVGQPTDPSLLQPRLRRLPQQRDEVAVVQQRCTDVLDDSAPCG